MHYVTHRRIIKRKLIIYTVLSIYEYVVIPRIIWSLMRIILLFCMLACILITLNSRVGGEGGGKVATGTELRLRAGYFILICLFFDFSPSDYYNFISSSNHSLASNVWQKVQLSLIIWAAGLTRSDYKYFDAWPRFRDDPVNKNRLQVSRRNHQK